MKKIAPYIDFLVLFLVVLFGLLNPSPILYYKWAIITFFILCVLIFSFATLVYFFSKNFGNKIQKNRTSPPKILLEAFGTGRAIFVVAFLAAWPISLSKLGYTTGWVWTIEETGLTWWMVLLQMYLGIVLVDAWTYWKHRLLHTKLMYPFHMHHHTFKDPTPFASFAVGPVETLLTFWPLLLSCLPGARHFAPLHYTAITSFVFLNFYLHSGVTFKFLEKILPSMILNSSAWHNIHHSDLVVNFGEVSYFWDKVCKTYKK